MERQQFKNFVKKNLNYRDLKRKKYVLFNIKQARILPPLQVVR